ncbi:hypothetical protein KEF29_24165 [Streptomyces tuirus]|uniref:Uncharacterized protein n=1 Tax=Streptomyces tuirus TaxID=68278 RepID=A0A941J2E3_9ACTN|nr:hypothetical protein [Streptomyces tuirus]
MEFYPCPRKHAQEIRVATGAVLCVPCVRQLHRQLRTLPELHQECLHDVLPAPGRRNPTKISGSRRRDYLNVSALDARSDVPAVLGSWADIVVAERATAAPRRSVPHLAGFLLRHLEWLVAQPPAADLADEIDRLHTGLARALEPDSGEHGPPAGTCVVDGCTGTIDASPKNTGNQGKRSISCSSGHSWEMREWLVLRHLMNGQRKDAVA